MPQQTNLSVAPYFDDFDANDDYHKVLFKPSYPVQARELNNLQSILQNQIEKFGEHFFKEGAKVIPGNTGYTQLYYGVQLDNNFQGVPVSAYIDQVVGTKITGSTSGVTAVVDKVLLADDSERNNLTLYINYLQSNTTNNSTQTFSDGEKLTCSQDLSSGLLGNSVITAGAPFATTLGTDCAVTGSAFQIQEGIYFVRGNFVNVETETLILDQYGTLPNYRIGLFVNEEIITPDMDESLSDNSQGYNNYSAPGADRLKISLSLFKKNIGDKDDNNFVELATVDNGTLRTKKVDNFGGGVFGYDITDTLARRTFDESGHYEVRPFDISFLNSLDDNIGNRGVFQAGQFTYGGDNPSDNLGLYKISPGKAYVKGYEIETTAPTWLDVDKPRSTKTIEDQSLIYNTGPTFKLDRVYRSPTIGIGNTYYLSLRDQRVGSNQDSAPGTEIGVARIYDFKLESGSYDSSNANINEWGMSLYDVQPFTNISLNQSHTLSVPTFVEGDSSGATGFIRYAVSAGTALTVYETTGNFIKNETLIFNGVPDGRISIAVTEHSISDVKSLYGTNDGVTGINTFSADVIQSKRWGVGISSITVASGGISTLRSDTLYNGVIKIGDLVRYTDTTVSNEDPVINRVTYVGTGTETASSYVNLEAVTTVTGIVNGALPASSQLAVTDLDVLTSNLDVSSDNTLFTRLPKGTVSNVDLTNATLTIRKSFTVNISSNEITSATKPTVGVDETFLPFTDKRYSLIRSDGTTEDLSADKVSFSANGKELSIRSLGTADTGATLVATITKAKAKAKKKIKNRVNSITITKSKDAGSGTGSTTLNDGLDYGNGNYPYGTRVQDQHLSLNTPDIIEIHGIYESADTSDASAPTMTLTSLNSASTTTTELIIGELLIGQTSGAVAVCAEKLNSSQITYISKNDFLFKEGETVVFQESAVQGIVSELDTGSFLISSNYTFSAGQQKTFYDYGSLRRKVDSASPTKKLKIYFASGYYDSTDEGDITTVNSYDTFNYAREIQSIDGIPNFDIIDIRPRTTAISSVAEGDRSPLEFFGRTFNGSGNSAANILASNENILIDMSYYQGRIDRIFLTKDGKFQVVYGSPSDNPQKPNPVDDAIELATVVLPPYLFNTSQVVLEFLEHKRFTMIDIKQLENRIQNLEYYTALSLLEVNTANMFVADNNGLNRFKSGFFVDNFSSFKAQDSTIPIQNSIDRRNKVLRPKHYTNSIDLIFGPVVNVDTSEDREFTPIQGTNVVRNNDVITLAYSDLIWLEQNFATRSESVTPFLISFWQGTLELTPASDTWVDTTRLEAKIIQTEGNYAETMADAAKTMNVDPQTGFAPIVWDAWETNWTGTETITTHRQRQTSSSSQFNRGGWINGGSGMAQIVRATTTTTIQEELRETRDTGVESRDGLRTIVTEQFDHTSVGDRVVSRDIIPWMRSRNIEFVAKRVKPLTRLYGFFDGEDVTRYCVPKLLEISMDSGTFTVGETVEGKSLQIGLGPNNTTVPSITFRVAQSNHREGPYNIPTDVYPENPYTGRILSASYSSVSTVLNIDTFSLCNEAQGEFYGWVETGMILTGQSSGAQATITNVRLISDLGANLNGSYYNPDPTNINHPRFETGTKTFTLVNDPDNDQNAATTIAEEAFTASGTMETVQENIISVRNARIEQKKEFQERNVNRSTGLQVVGSQIVGRSTSETIVGWYDPLAQSFLVEEDSGIFLTKCDIFFRSKDDMDIPVVFQLRTMKNGFPTQHVLPFSEIVLSPTDINISADGSVATTIEFKAPIYLEGSNTEYAIALASNSTKYSVYISRIGENDLLTQTYISNQPYLGSLFKSQNASTWEASQWEDLKFTLYRANFLKTGQVEFYNPELTKGNHQIPILMPDSLILNSRKVRVGLGTTIADSGYELGNTFTQADSNLSANLVGSAGTAQGTCTISNAGIGYTPVDGGYTFTGVNLVTLTGNGRGATGDITVTNGVAVAATISGGGSGYQVGDVLGITTIGIATIGSNARFTITGIGETSELIFDNVQGNVKTGIANTFFYTNSAGVTTELNYGLPGGVGGAVTATSVNVDTDGTHIKVNHQNHGMYFGNNIVQISGVDSDIKPTKLSVAYNTGSTGNISVDSGTSFSTFENVGVGTTNVGFLKIGEEIIEYTNVSGNTIGGNIVRGSNQSNYPVGTPVYKYELGGVNLKRINGIHTLSDATVSEPITFDSYHIKLNMSQTFNSNNDDRSNDTGFPALYLNQSKSSGGYKIRATQNMPFEVMTPIVQNVTVRGTSLAGQVRTVTSSSINGTEIPYIDAGFETISLNSANYFDSPRMVASKLNEDGNLNTLPGSKSMNLRLILETTDPKISPVIDAQRVSTILTSSRVNNTITNYATDKRVNSIDADPTACKYISKEIILENPATSLKILTSAHINVNCDIRAFYAIGDGVGFVPIFTPFPGYNNINGRGQVIAPENNNGESDVFVSKTNTYGFNSEQLEFKEYTFTVDQLPSFRSYKIKIVLTSNSQVFVPQIKDLRVMALA